LAGWVMYGSMTAVEELRLESSAQEFLSGDDATLIGGRALWQSANDVLLEGGSVAEGFDVGRAR
jgi:hypothetical protein